MNPLEELQSRIEAANLWEEEIILERNQYLKVQGSTDTNIYHVLDGSLRAYVVDEEEEHTIRFAYRNNFFAALDSFITESPSELYIQAVKRTVVKRISKAAYMKFMSDSEETQQLWQLLLEMVVVQQLERERDLLTSSPLTRYQRVLKRSPQLFQEIPSKYIASYLRMTPETLSRMKKS
jgi:CRP-like cAMP-binding protein